MTQDSSAGFAPGLVTHSARLRRNVLTSTRESTIYTGSMIALIKTFHIADRNILGKVHIGHYRGDRAYKRAFCDINIGRAIHLARPLSLAADPQLRFVHRFVVKLPLYVYNDAGFHPSFGPFNKTTCPHIFAIARNFPLDVNLQQCVSFNCTAVFVHY